MEKGRDICFNFNQICRFCLSQGGVMSAIFADSGQEITSLPAKIMSCVSIQIYAGDGLPALICHRCLYQVERSYEFKEQCEHSDATLRQFVKKQRMGEVCQAMTVKLENAEEESNDEDQLENGMDHCESDCTSPQDDTTKIKCEEKGEKSADNEHSQEEDHDIETFVVNVDPYEMEEKEQITVGEKHRHAQPTSVVQNNKESFEENILSESKVIKPFLCDVCFKSFSDRAYLRTHMQLHTGIRAHRCNLCSKAFVRRRELLRHEKVHSGERPYGCNICGKRFSRRDKLTRHEKIHAEHRRHKCELCPASFLRSDELTRHAMCHTGERPWCCSVCYKSFFSKAELNRHSKTHADVKPYKCDLCTMAFCRKDKLTRHQKTHANKQRLFKFSEISCRKSDSITNESEMNNSLTLKHLSSPDVDGNFRNNRKSVSDEEVTKEEDVEDPEVSLSRLGQNPEILLFPISQP